MSVGLSTHTKACRSVTHTAWWSVIHILSVGLSLIRYLLLCHSRAISRSVLSIDLSRILRVALSLRHTARSQAVKPTHRLTLLSVNFSRGATRCYAVLRGATRCYAVLRGATRCYAVLRGATRCSRPVCYSLTLRESLKGIARTKGIVCKKVLCVKGIMSRSIG